MNKFDAHIHTCYSQCSNISIESLLEKSEKEGLHSIMITDHNTTKGAIIATKIAKQKKYLVNVILGIELKTTFGEVNAIFLNEEECNVLENIEKNNGIYDFFKIHYVVEDMKKEGSDVLLGLNHPFSFDYFSKRGGFDFVRILLNHRNYSMTGIMDCFDYTEINAGCLSKEENDSAYKLGTEHQKPILCTTDSHFIGQIGQYFCETDNSNIREAILSKDFVRNAKPEDINYIQSRIQRTKSGILKSIKKYF